MSHQLVQRYGSPATRLPKLMRHLQLPFEGLREGDRVLVMTDDAMDPLVWQAAMAVAYEHGAEPTLCLFPRLPFHCADPPPAALAAAKESDLLVCLTTTCLNSGTPGLRSIKDHGRTSYMLMEESTVEILAEGGGAISREELLEICALQSRIGAAFDRGHTIRVTSASGTDLTAEIGGYPPGYHERRWGQIPGRDPDRNRFISGTWPIGEAHVEPRPGTANGVVVWDTSAHHPEGLFSRPVRLVIRDGVVVAIEGGHEAAAVDAYLREFGDENARSVGGEIALGTNKRCPLATGIMRSDKKRYGSMHFGIGHGADRGLVNSNLRLEGVTQKITMMVDETVVCRDGEILV